MNKPIMTNFSADRICKVLGEILTDKYGEKYGCEITITATRKEPKSENTDNSQEGTA